MGLEDKVGAVLPLNSELVKTVVIENNTDVDLACVGVYVRPDGEINRELLPTGCR
jgi:hypothetical protein